MEPYIIVILIVFFSSFIFTVFNPKDIEETVTKPIDKLSREDKAELAPHLGVVYVGMPKEDLKKAGYTELTQKGYRKEGNEEWITYLNWANQDSDLVTFYIVDGKVKGWKER